MFRRHPFLDDAAAGGGGAPPAPPAQKVNALVSSLTLRYGSAENALSTLAAQLIGHEQQAQTDRETIEGLKKKLPADGSFVLTPDQGKQWTAFQALNLKPEQITEVIKERDTLKGSVHSHGIEKLAREGAPNIGFDPDATADLITSKHLYAELREVEVEVTKNGKKEKVKQKVPFVRPAAEEKAQLQPLSEYAKTLPAFEQRALAAATADRTGAAPAATTGTPYPDSRPTPAKGTSGDVTADFISQRNQRAASRPSPFSPPRQPAAATT